jgi:hypothetical protein
LQCRSVAFEVKDNTEQHGHLLGSTVLSNAFLANCIKDKHAGLTQVFKRGCSGQYLKKEIFRGSVGRRVSVTLSYFF